MRKRSVQEIIEVTTAGGTPITSSSTRQQRIQQTASAAEKKIADERNKAQKAKPSIDQQRIDLAKYQSKTDRMKVNLKKKRENAIKKAEAAKERSSEQETQAKVVKSRENLRKTIAGNKKPNIQKTKGGNKSISDTGTVAANAIKRTASLGRNVVGISANIAKQKAKARLGDMQMKDNKAPEGGTIRQKVGFATRQSRERINTAVTNTRRKAGRGIEKVGTRLANEDYIHEAEKDSSKEVENKTIDVMKGKNAVEVNPKIQAEETMSPAQKRKDTNLKKKYDDSDMKQNMIDQYGKEEGMKVYYATIRKQAMKTESVLEVQSVSDGLKFREYEFIDVIKNKPMKSPKNNITWTEQVGSDGEGLTPSEQRKGLGMSGSGIRKLKKDMEKKGNFDVETNLKKKTPDEQHTTTTSEAKMPVQGLVKLAAMVADNNKKRKNALQIQKYIGEDKKMGRQSDEALAAAHKKFSSMDQTSPANSFMTKRIQKEIDRRKKIKPDVTNEETIVEKSNTGPKSPKADTRIKNRTAFTQDRVLNSTPEEERGAAKRKSTAEMIRQQKRDEVQKKKDAFKKK